MVDKPSSLLPQVQNMKQTAVFADSKDKKRAYRYLLTREWNTNAEKPNLACFIMQNPSTGDEYVDDPAIDKCIKLVQCWDCKNNLSHDGIAIVNLYARVGSSGKQTFQGIKDAIGPENDEFIREAISQYSDSIIVAWGNGSGNPPKFMHRCKSVWAMLPKAGIYCLGTTKMGQPHYPTSADNLHIQKWPREL